MIGLIVNTVADILEWSGRTLRQTRRDFEAAKIRAAKARQMPQDERPSR